MRALFSERFEKGELETLASLLDRLPMRDGDDEAPASPTSSDGLIELYPLTPAFLEAILDERREEAAALLGAVLPDEFPREGERRFLTLRLGQMRENAGFEDWSPFAVVLGGHMIGHAGYHGPPGVNTKQNPDAVELGYTIEPEYRRRGLREGCCT